MTKKELCKQYGINYNSLRGWISSRPNLVHADFQLKLQAYLEFLQNKPDINKAELCRQHNISSSIVVHDWIERNQPDLINADFRLQLQTYIDWKNNTPITKEELCRQHSIKNSSVVTNWIKDHRRDLINADFQLQIQAYIDWRNNHITLKEKCKILGLNYGNVVSYKYDHNLTDEQAIIHYRPELTINMFGRLIDQEGNIIY